MQIVLTGLSHKTAPLPLRERLVLSGAALRETLLALSAATPVSECALLSTCNRTEIYAVSDDIGWQEAVVEFLAGQAQMGVGSLQEHLYLFEGRPAVRHLFRVASGLDSMVVGEGQVLSQVKEALAEASQAGTAGSLIHGLFQQAIAAGKRARSDTEINRGAVSISLAAVHLARQIFGRLGGRRVLLVGAGENSEQTARLLKSGSPPPEILVTNRTPGRAEELAERIGADTVPFGDLDEALARADIVISSTGAPEPIVGPEAAHRAMRARRGRPLFLIDIAVPRDVDERVGDLDDVFLYNIDDLRSVVERSLQARQSEVSKVEEIVEEEVGRFHGWLRGREVAPTIGELTRRAEDLVAAELQRSGVALAELTEEQRRVVEETARRIARRLLHYPIIHLRGAAHSGNGYHEVNAIRAIFRLDEPVVEEEETGA